MHDQAAPDVARQQEAPHADTSAGDQSRATSRRLFLFILALAVFNGVVTGSMVNVLLPLIRADFVASPAEAGWIITGFALAYAVGIPIYGRIASVYGVRRLFVIGLLGFAIGGLVSALAPNLPLLVLGRGMQGLAGAAVPALAAVAIAMVLPPGSRGAALGVIVSSVGIGQVAGPIVGGAVGQVAEWRFLFLATLLLALFIIPGAWRVLPDGGAGGERRFDIVGGVLLGLAAGLILFGVTQGQTAGFGAFRSWGSILGGLVAAAGFAWRITHVSDPFVSPQLFRNRAYVAASGVAFFTMAAYLSTIVMVPLLLIEVNGLTPANAGLVLTPGALAVAILSPISGRLSDRIGVRIPVLTGLAVMGCSILFLSAFAAGASPLLMAAGMLGVGVGFALESSPLSNAAANSLPAAQVGEGMGLYQSFFFLGGGIGAALTATLLAARREAPSAAFNPLYALDAAPFSDVFFALAAVVVVALFVALGLRHRAPDGGAPASAT
jgi:DHA2 family metal-tetracycline-proton antiporter-like MFS transporter/DHA2 family florfenicol/chloramphenicol resistance protein-like MFS transporter